MLKITANQAKARLKQGKEVIICPSKCSPYSMFASKYDNKDIVNQWESFINSYKYYNCTSETGLAIHYYIGD